MVVPRSPASSFSATLCISGSEAALSNVLPTSALLRWLKIMLSLVSTRKAAASSISTKYCQNHSQSMQVKIVASVYNGNLTNSLAI